MLGTLFYFTYWQFILGRFNGPLITFTTNGFMDHMQTPPREISWADIKYIKFFKNSKMLIPGMHIQLKHPSLKDRIRQIFGVYRYRYAGQILSVSTDKIKSFLYGHAPEGVFK